MTEHSHSLIGNKRRDIRSRSFVHVAAKICCTNMTPHLRLSSYQLYEILAAWIFVMCRVQLGLDADRSLTYYSIPYRTRPQMGFGNLGPCHANQINQSLANSMACCRNIANSRGMKHRQAAFLQSTSVAGGDDAVSKRQVLELERLKQRITIF